MFTSNLTEQMRVARLILTDRLSAAAGGGRPGHLSLVCGFASSRLQAGSELLPALRSALRQRPEWPQPDEDPGDRSIHVHGRGPGGIEQMRVSRDAAYGLPLAELDALKRQLCAVRDPTQVHFAYIGGPIFGCPAD